MNRINIIFLLFFLVLSCNPKSNIEIPENIIQPEEMAKIYRDVHLYDAYLSQKRYQINSKYLIINSYYKDLYDKYGYSRAQIDTSMRFYARYPELMDDIYDQVLIDLSKLEDSILINKK